MKYAGLVFLFSTFALFSACAGLAHATRITTPNGVRIEHNGASSKPLHVEHTAADGARTIIDGATAPADATPADHAKARILQWYNLAAIALIIAAAVATWRGYIRAAICLGIAGIAAPMLGNFGLSKWALVITAAFVCAALAYVSAWYAMRHKLSPDTPAATA